MDPTLIAFGGMLALILGVAFFDDDDDSAEELRLDPEAGTVTGTSGADIIDLAEINSGTDQYSDVDAAGGDDTVTSATSGDILGDIGNDILIVSGDQDGLVDGGTGNDVLNVTSVTQDISGGDGNDTINYSGNVTLARTESFMLDAGAGDDILNVVLNGVSEESDQTWASVEILGGAGNDTISVSADGEQDVYSTYIEMGDGDDLLIVDHATGSFNDGAGNDTIRVEGANAGPVVGSPWRGGNSGAGNDIYEITLLPDENAQPTILDRPTAFGIGDFEAGVDTLVVDPYSLAGDATYTGYELEWLGETGYQYVVFHYTHPDYPNGLMLAVSISGNGLTPDDIEIIGAPATAAAA